MNFVKDAYETLSNMNRREYMERIINLSMVVCSALAIWKSLMVITNTQGPICVVLSASMEPALFRGDILLMTNYESDPIRVGEIVIFKIEGKEIPIVHRVLEIHERADLSFDILTKGDNNDGYDHGLYAKDQLWLNSKHIIGRARFTVPYIGMITIKLTEKPIIKYIVIGFFAFLILLNKEE